ncbi:MAG: sterol desaturase family protein [Pseudomonadota bacterium]
MEFLTDFLDKLPTMFQDFYDPKKRVFVGYLFLSLLIALVWLVLVRRTRLAEAWRTFFDRNVFFSPSAQADYKIFVINRLFSFLISPLLVTQLIIGTAIYFWLHGIDFLHVGYFRATDPAVIVALFTATMFVVDDLTKYLVHRWMHKWPILWAIHKTHHSAETLTPVTVYRIHPLEGVLYGLRGTVAQGTVIAVFFYLFGNAVTLYTVLGANILVFVFHITGSNLRHSHINISYWPWLERVLISPAQHQLHHSVAEEHYDKNFGAALAVWDWLFGSLHLSEPERELTYGLDPSEKSEPVRLWDIYTGPVVEIWQISVRTVFGVVGRVLSIFRVKRLDPINAAPNGSPEPTPQASTQKF